MANERKTYKRKISGEEAQGVYIMILKNELDFFPKIGKPFKLKVKAESEEKTFDSTINAVQCWCMGPKKPHSHYRIDARPFRDVFPIHFGKKIIITKNSDDEYTLS
jgi:hypothetical protein